MSALTTRDVSPIHVLLVEDNLGDVRLTREALRESQVPLVLHIASDGIAALEFLEREGAFHDAPRPSLILLDLNLPRLDGHGVLAAIKADASLMEIPVIVLTTSESSTDVMRSYELHANCYVTKPIDLDSYVAMFHFWLTVARLPRAPERSGVTP